MGRSGWVLTAHVRDGALRAPVELAGQAAARGGMQLVARVRERLGAARRQLRLLAHAAQHAQLRVQPVAEVVHLHTQTMPTLYATYITNLALRHS